MKTLVARQTGEQGSEVRLTCPAVGSFRSCHEPGESLEPGAILGILSVLNRRYAVSVPEGNQGLVTESIGYGTHDVEYGSALVTLDGRISDGSAGACSPAGESATRGDTADEQLICSPIDGIFYSRPEPGADPFVSVGDRIRPGQVVAMVEVMKTFNPIRWQPNSGEEAVVLRVDAQDQQEVASGQILLVLSSAD